MSLIDKFKGFVSKSNQAETTNSGNKPSKDKVSPLNKIGNIEPLCPYCNYMLGKKPAQKKKCPNCGNYIFVRTRPIDREKVLVTEEQVALVEEQWNIYYEQKEREKLESDPEYRQMQSKLTKKWGFEPPINDIRWALANEYLLKHAKDGNWGLYRNTRLEMAGILRKEKKPKEALRTYLEVCYLDINGPMNRGGINDPQLLKEYPPFDPKQAFLAPGVTGEIQDLVEELGLQTEEVKSLFSETAKISHNALKLSIDPTKAWNKIHAEVIKTT